jgi:cell division transport system permease protein
VSARWSYILQEAFIGLRRNLWMTVAVVLSVTVSLALFGASVLLREQVDLATDEWTDKIEVSIFLCDDRQCPAITQEQQAALRRDLEANPLVEQVFFESKEDAYERFLERFEGQEDFTQGVTADQLPASFRVKLQDPEQFTAIKAQYEATPGVEDIIDQRELLEQFLQFARTIRWSALAVAVIQMLAATVLVANTVRVAAFARRDQTQIMKLVGASNWYIRLPFVLEGILAGLAGAAVAWGLLLLSVPWLTSTLEETIQFVPFIGTGDALAVWPWLLVPAVLISGLSSLAALWGFLDV